MSRSRIAKEKHCVVSIPKEAVYCLVSPSIRATPYHALELAFLCLRLIAFLKNLYICSLPQGKQYKNVENM